MTIASSVVLIGTPKDDTSIPQENSDTIKILRSVGKVNSF